MGLVVFVLRGDLRDLARNNARCACRNHNNFDNDNNNGLRLATHFLCPARNALCYRTGAVAPRLM